MATVLAPAPDILRFCAHHLQLGAHRVFVFLDDPDDRAFDALKAHPKVRPTRCDTAHWKKIIGKRPDRHQVRQSKNANFAYARAADVDWLAHIDVDEFLLPETSVATHLAAIPEDVLCARVRPVEPLIGAEGVFKRAVPKGPNYHNAINQLYPNWGQHLRGGFLSHLLGKLFVRTGLENTELRIHNAYINQERNPGLVELHDMPLAHLHAASWEQFRALLDYRLRKGSYRAELRPNRAREKGGFTLHELFHQIITEQGEDGLHAMFDEVSKARPELIAGLEEFDLLVKKGFQPDVAMAAEFPAVFDPKDGAC